MTMTATLSDSAVLNDTVVQLGALASAYQQVLEQAKQQLEQLELSEVQLQRIERNLGNHLDYERVARHLAYAIDSVPEIEIGTGNHEGVDALSGEIPQRWREEGSHSSACSYLLSTVAKRISRRLNDDATQAVKEQIIEQRIALRDDLIAYADVRIKATLDDERSRALRKATEELENTRWMLRNLFTAAFSEQEIERIAAAASQSKPPSVDLAS